MPYFHTHLNVPIGFEVGSEIGWASGCSTCKPVYDSGTSKIPNVVNRKDFVGIIPRQRTRAF